MKKILEKEVKKRIMQAFKVFGTMFADYVLQIAKDEIAEGEFVTAGGFKVKGALNTGELMRSGVRRVKKDHIIIGFAADHAEDVEYGLTAVEARKKVKYNHILQWVKDKQIAKGNTAKWAAKNILKHIHNNGISPRPFFRRAISEAENKKEQIMQMSLPQMKQILEGDPIAVPDEAI